MKAVVWTALERLGANGIGAVFLLLFASYLDAEAYGIFSFFGIAVAFFSLLSQLALDQAVIQRESLDDRALSTIFWIIVFASLCVSVIAVCGTLLIDEVSGQPNLKILCALLVVTVFFTSVSELLTALIKRDLKIKQLARRSVIANLISGLLATPFVFSGYGFWALLVQYIMGILITFTLNLYIARLPVQFVFDSKVATDLLRFSLPALGERLLNRYNHESPKFLVGMLLGVEALGLFSMAWRVMMLMHIVFGSISAQVGLPLFSKIFRDAPDQLPDAFLRTLVVWVSVGLPIYLLTIIESQVIVDVMLGLGWSDAGPLVAVLLGGGFFLAMGIITQVVILCLGEARRLFGIAMVSIVLGTALLLLAAPFGLYATSCAFVLRVLVVEPFKLYTAMRLLNIAFVDVAMQLRSPLLSSLIMVAGVYCVAFVTADLASYIQLVVSTVAGLLIYVAVFWFLDRKVVLYFVSLVISLKNKPRPS